MYFKLYSYLIINYINFHINFHDVNLINFIHYQILFLDDLFKVIYHIKYQCLPFKVKFIQYL